MPGCRRPFDWTLRNRSASGQRTRSSSSIDLHGARDSCTAPARYVAHLGHTAHGSAEARPQRPRANALGLAAALCFFAGSARANCPADLNADCTHDVFDLLAFFDRFAAGSPTADLDGNGASNIFDILAFAGAFAEGCDGAGDRDGDRILDCYETNTGIFISATDTGTDPDNPDTDGDGLSDGDEVIGTLSGLDLSVFGTLPGGRQPPVSPLRRDILVEVDYTGINDSRPNILAWLRLMQAYRAAPVSNPDGSTGINLVMDFGQFGAASGGNQIPVPDDGDVSFSDVAGIKAVHFDPRRLGYFHYCISANNDAGSVAELSGDDFLIDLGDCCRGDTPWMSLFMHEIGHNFGLRHGGFEDQNFKPNYNSVMNYRYGVGGSTGLDIDLDGRSDRNDIGYSSGTRPDFDENAIFEAVGLGGAPIDWNGNGIIDPQPIALDVNFDYNEVRPCAPGRCSVLRDFDDWSNLNWRRLPRPAPLGPSAPMMAGPDSDQLAEPAPELIHCDPFSAH